MTDSGTPAPPPNFATFIQSLLSFDKMIGKPLATIAYYVGLAGTLLWALLTFLSSFSMMQLSPQIGLSVMIGALLGGAAGVLMWRFFCELFLLAFMIFDRLGEIRDRLPPR